MFPTRLFFEAAYPLQSTDFIDRENDILVNYTPEWRYYFGVLFDFDIRVDKQLRRIR
jgi:hypothetical protein